MSSELVKTGLNDLDELAKIEPYGSKYSSLYKSMKKEYDTMDSYTQKQFDRLPKPFA